MNVISQDQLPASVIAREFVGDEHGDGAPVSLVLIEAPPGKGPRLHRHPYPQVVVVQEGEATFVVGDDERVVRGGEIVVIGAGVPHRFVNSGSGTLRQIDVHTSPRFVTEWLEDAPRT